MHHGETVEKPGPSPVTAADMLVITQQVEAALAEGAARAAASGKPLLVLIGEQHIDPNALLQETLIYQLARKHGVRDVMLEVPADSEDLMNKKETLRRGTTANVMSLYQQAAFRGDATHLVDMLGLAKTMAEIRAQGDIPQTQEALEEQLKIAERNGSMIAKMVAINAPSMMVTGTLHLDGLRNDPLLNNAYEIVSFNVSPSAATACVQRDNSSRTVHVVSLKGDAREMDDDAIYRLAMGAEEGNRFIAHAEEKGVKLSDADAWRRFSEATIKLIHAPENIATHMKLSRAFYDLGFDEAAGQKANAVLGMCAGSADITKSACATAVVLSNLSGSATFREAALGTMAPPILPACTVSEDQKTK